MAIDGTYGFAYRAVNGMGIGVFTVTSGKFTGCDYAGGRYTGTATENPDGTIEIDIDFDVMPGAMLVQGTAAQDVPHLRGIHHTMPPAFGDGRLEEVPSPPGTVTVMVKRIPNEWAPYTDGFHIELGPAKPRAA
jgi:hypothetical protein